MDAPPPDPPASRRAQHLAAKMTSALALRQQGRLAEADARCAEVLADDPRHSPAYHLRGLVAVERGDFARGLSLFEAALRLEPNSAGVLFTRGNALLAMGKLDEAVRSYDAVLAIEPGNSQALNNKGLTLVHLAAPGDALRAFEAALRLDPGFAAARQNCGAVLMELGRHAEALDAYSRILRDKPNDLAAMLGRGNAQMGLERLEEARASFTRILDIDPRHRDALLNRGVVLHRLGQLQSALADYETVLRSMHDSVLALGNSANVLQDLGKPEEALRRYDRALEISPAHANNLCGRGLALLQLKEHAAASISFERALALAPRHALARESLLRCRLACCDWTDHGAQHAQVHDLLTQSRQVGNPVMLMLFDDPGMQLDCAREVVSRKHPARREMTARPAGREKIRLAYVSADFREHPVARLLAGVIERHDRERFEVFGYSLNPGVDGAFDRRLRNAFDAYAEVGHSSDAEIAETLRDQRVDIAVDLMGLTEGLRLSIFAHAAAPVQVAYLGYAGTTGAPYMHYLMADSVVAPAGSEHLFAERLVRLPDCFLPYDDRREIGTVPSRAAVGLPEHGFVFCAFTQPHKINPPIFEVWMRLLRDVAGSVLWLRDMGTVAAVNLRKQAELRGISSERLIFAPRVSNAADHLARQALADLYLDTLPYNAHSTACDALWTGVPVLTCAGSSFASRVAASALGAVALPELIARNLDDYECRGRELALDPRRIQSLHRHLVERRAELRLFDTARYTKRLEASFRAMHERALRGEPPASFDIAPE
jgi:protein O-GlcNAc transferase